MFLYNWYPCGAFTIIAAHLRSPLTFSGHLPLGFCIIEYYFQLLPHRAALPANTESYKYLEVDFLTSLQGILQPMPNWYREIKTHLPCFDEF